MKRSNPLGPGAYTAIVSGVAQGTGVGIVEVFEVNAVTVPLINIATRGRVQTGDNVMIGGFIIQGDGPQTVVVRARGPSLAQFNVPGLLANPQLQLFSGPTVIASNDNWQQAANQAAIQAALLELQNAKLRLVIRMRREAVLPVDVVRKLGADLGNAVSRATRRLHLLAPSIVGFPVEVVTARLNEAEDEICSLVDQKLDFHKVWNSLAAEAETRAVTDRDRRTRRRRCGRGLPFPSAPNQRARYDRECRSHRC